MSEATLAAEMVIHIKMIDDRPRQLGWHVLNFGFPEPTPADVEDKSR